MRRDRELVYHAIRDLIVDIRQARRLGQEEYERKCIAELQEWLPRRHALTVDRYGWPRAKEAA